MLTLICGLPNAGKTTFSQQYKNALHLDEIGLLDNVLNAIKRTDGDVVIEGYFGTADVRSRICSAYDGQKECIFLDVTIEESIRRENRNRHEQILRNASRFFEPPTLDEGWGELIIIKGDDDVQRYSRQTKN